MFARLLMFSFLVFIAHDALASKEFEPKVPINRLNDDVSIQRDRGHIPDWVQR